MFCWLYFISAFM